jgi:hypothetical protein
VNSEGKLTRKLTSLYDLSFQNSRCLSLSATQSSHYAQAHALLNLQLIHASPALSSPDDDEPEGQAAGFGIYSPLRPTMASAVGESPSPANDFTPQDLLSVCRRLLKERYLSYFPLCREMGAKVVDGLVRGTICQAYFETELN